MNKRGSGILQHISCLPSAFGIGDLGPEAYEFVDFLTECRQQYWQILPLNPTDPVHSNSPYHSCSAFAGNPLLISPELIVEKGFLDQESLNQTPDFPMNRVDFASVIPFKEDLIEKAFIHFSDHPRPQDFQLFYDQNAYWLEDYALFKVLKALFKGRTWSDWVVELRDRQPEALDQAKEEHARALERIYFEQYLFFTQWQALKRYSNEKGIRIFGDMPIYVVYDSVDVWTHSELFNLDKDKKPITVAGVPPDYFSETGQLWGNPVYRWDTLKELGYDWWIMRMEHNLRLFDLVRIDHFRGFVAYWEVPASEKNAIKGQWVQASADDFFQKVLEKIPRDSIIAEDLGLITPDVEEVMKRFNLPGMKVLLFAFNDNPATNPYAPHNHVEHCVVYTGTHDNNTARGWFENELSPEMKRMFFSYLGREVTVENVHIELIRLAMMSVAEMIIIPLQDLLGLDQRARMNLPASKTGNWQWRLLPNQINEILSRTLKEMTEIYGRA